MKLHERLQAVWASRATATEKALLVIIAASGSDDEDRPVWLSAETIADRSGFGRSTVVATLRALEASGVLVVERPMGLAARRWIEWGALRSLAARPVAKPKSAPVARGYPDSGPVQQLDPSSSWTGGVQILDGGIQILDPGVQILDGGGPDSGPDPIIDPIKDPIKDPISDPSRARDPSPGVLVLLPVQPPPTAAKVKAKGKATDPEAFRRCEEHWKAISGKRRALDPTKGEGRVLMEALAKAGKRVELRLAYLAMLNGTGPAAFIREKGLNIANVLRLNSDWGKALDVAAEEWDADGRSSVRERASPPQRKASGGGGGFMAALAARLGQVGGEVLDGDL